MYLSAKRVVRTFGSFFLILAIVLWSAFFFVNSLTAVAVELVEKALSRYNNFTGKIALQNFAEDKILYQQVQNLQETVLPFLELLLPIIVVLAVLLSVASILCFVLPNQCAALLIRIKLWKDISSENTENSFESKPSLSIPWKKILLVFFPIILLLLAVLGIRSCTSISPKEANQDLEKAALHYIEFVKSGFSKDQKIHIPDSFPESEIFKFEIQKGRFVAILNEQVEDCKVGSSWTIFPSVKGLFKKTLSLYRKSPADSSCQVIAPDFKSIGKK